MPPTRMRLSFVVYGPPVPKARARTVRSNGKVRSFTPGKTADYESLVSMRALEARCKTKQWPHLNKAMRFGLSVRVHRSIERGDLDNFIKAVLDACNGVLWVDDSQVRQFSECSVDECGKGKERIEVDVWVIDPAQPTTRQS